MTKTYELAPETEEELVTFLPDHEASIDDIRRVIAPQNTQDEVEKARLRMVGASVNELLRSDLPSPEVQAHEALIHNLGAEAILEYLPGHTL